MACGLTGIVDKASNIHRTDSVLFQIPFIKAEHHRKIAACGGTAYKYLITAAKKFLVLEHPSHCIGTILNKIGKFCFRVEPVLDTYGADALLCQHRRKIIAIVFCAGLDAAAVDVQKHRIDLSVRQVNIQHLSMAVIHNICFLNHFTSPFLSNALFLKYSARSVPTITRFKT